MAKPVSEEELQLKKRARRRLIGAIALVAGVAAVLPMVLDPEPKPTSRDINIQIPSPESKVIGAVPPKVAVLPPAKAPAKKAEPPAVEAPAAKADVAEKTAAKPEAKAPAAEKPAAKAQAAEKPVVKSAEKPAVAEKPLPVPDNPNDAVLVPRIVRENAAAQEKPAAKAPEKAAEKALAKVAEKAPEKAVEKTAAPKAGAGAFFIQVVALSDAEKAKQVQQRIAGAGVRAYTEVVTADAGKITRVRAGPFATREEAENARGKLQGIGLEGRVAAY